MEHQSEAPTIEELALQSSFQQWVRYPTPMLDQYWERWMQEHPDRITLVNQARDLVLSLHFPDDLEPEEIDEEWLKMQYLIQQESTEDIPVYQIERRRSSGFWISRAAIFTGVLLGIALVYTWMRPLPMLTYKSGYGQVKNVILPDGSTVVLNAHSSIQLAATWDANKPREVWMDGEAYFSVKHQSNNQRFLVHTPDSMTVEVLGTTFTVLSRTTQSRVVLNTGKIRLHRQIAGKSEAVLMQPGEQIALKKETKKLEKRMVNPEIYKGFTDNKLIFQNTPLPEIISQLEELYNLEVQTTDSLLLKKEFTGTFPINKPSLLLEAITRAYKLQVIKERNRLVLEPVKDTL